MLRSSSLCLASGCLAASGPLLARVRYDTMLDDTAATTRAAMREKKLTGGISLGSKVDQNRARRSLHAFATDAKDRRKLTDLPGVEHAAELPADPLTRIFFQHKAEHALFHGDFVKPARTDEDRVELARRHTPKNMRLRGTVGAVHDFCHRIREGSEERKRFVVVPSTVETKGMALILKKHGILSGFRDFANDRAFAVELKYFQNEPVLVDAIPATNDIEREHEWTPRMVRSFGKVAGSTNNIRIYTLRTWDGRILDQMDATREGIGGRGLAVFF